MNHFDELINYIHKLANSYANSVYDHDDLVQEAYLVCVKCDGEEKPFTMRAIRNRFNDLFRNQKYRNTSEIDFDCTPVVHLDSTEHMLQELQKAVGEKFVVINEILNPSADTVSLAIQDFNEKQQATGLVMNKHQVKILDRHIASVLNLSVATVSRTKNMVRGILEDK